MGKEASLSQLLILTTDKPRFADMSAELQRQDAIVSWASSGDRALEWLRDHPVDLVVVDEKLGDMTGLAFIAQLLPVNPMINCALVSSLAAQAYHEAGEGLGILMQLPPRPDRNDGLRLMDHLARIAGSFPRPKGSEVKP
jgi:two-component SAPR family response regulator